MTADDSECGPFIQGILDEPDEIASYLVYADWLEEQGDPRAELIRLQCELEFHPPAPFEVSPLLARCDELLSRYQREWLSELAPVLLDERNEGQRFGRPPQHAFRRGFLDELILHAVPEEVSEILLPTPATDFLRRLTFEGIGGCLANLKVPKGPTPALPNLRRLRLLAGDCRGIDDVLMHTPRLEHLHLHAGEFSEAALASPLNHLRELVIVNGLPRLNGIGANPTLTNVETLWLNAVTEEGFEAVVRAQNLTSLRFLVLRGIEVTDERLRQMLDAGMFDRLISLELNGRLSSAAITYLISQDFSGLTRLSTAQRLPSELLEKLAENEGNLTAIGRGF